MAVRTQQILLHESGGRRRRRPASGLVLRRDRTYEVEEEASGAARPNRRASAGLIAAIESGHAERMIADSAWEQQIAHQARRAAHRRRQRVRARRSVAGGSSCSALDPAGPREVSSNGGARRSASVRSVAPPSAAIEARRSRPPGEPHGRYRGGGPGPLHGRGDLRHTAFGLGRVPTPRGVPEMTAERHPTRSSLPSPVWTVTTGARKVIGARCATPVWRSSTRGSSRARSLSRAVLQEDAQVLGMSSLVGAHIEYARTWPRCSRAKGLDDVLVLVGGTIPDADAEQLRAVGIAGVFGLGHPHRRGDQVHRAARRPAHPGLARDGRFKCKEEM